MLTAVLIAGVACIGHAEEPLARHVRVLSAEIGARNVLHYDNLERAAEYIRDEFRKCGYLPVDDSYAMEKREFRGRMVRNIVAVKEGTAAKGKVIIVCAHYDSYHEAPGADDNASGVASLLELARMIRGETLSKTVRFIAFTNEELELIFDDADTGSYRYARAARKAGEEIEAVICLDMTGYYSHEPGSQHMPLFFRLFYPDIGDFIGIGGDTGSYDLVESTAAAFRKAATIPCRYLVMPAAILPQLMTTDNRAFWAFGYKSVWITDTCIYRNPYMHTAHDVAATLDYRNMAKVVANVRDAVVDLAR